MHPDREVGPARVALVQSKPRKGAYAENLAALRAVFAQLASLEPVPQLVVLPEAALTGYFLEGAVYESARSAERFGHELSSLWRDVAGQRSVEIAAGFYEVDNGSYYNSAIWLALDERETRILHVHRKLFLPTYGVFDEERFLSRGNRASVFESPLLGATALLICEDAWHSIMPTIAALKGARLIVVPSAAPGRGIDGEGELLSISRWRELLRGIAMEHGCFVLYAGLAGFEGGKGMTGSSRAIAPSGEMLVEADASEACIVRAELFLDEVEIARANLPLLGDLRAVLPDLLADDELPWLRGRSDASGS
uniref:Carbon-nitrogen hydrolase family protein n=1 Tax=mine drainage metagenome TaxID=410659 RepID=E6PC67_9ZZZZ